MDWCWEGHERTGFILDTLTPTSENIFSGFIVFVSQIMIVNIYKHLLINHSCNVVEVSPKGFFAQKIQSGFLDQCQKEEKGAWTEVTGIILIPTSRMKMSKFYRLKIKEKKLFFISARRCLRIKLGWWSK